MDLNKLSDQLLVEKALEGDNKAYDFLFERYRNRLLVIILQKCQGGDQAEDIVQDTFIKSYMNLDRYDSKYSFGQWIYTIARNLFIDYTRSKHEKYIVDRTYYIEAPSDTQTPEEKIISQQSHSQIESLLAELPEHYRKMIELRFWNEYSYEEIAEKLGMPIGTVKTQIHRARVRLCHMITSRKLV